MVNIKFLPCFQYFFSWVKAINEQSRFHAFWRVVNGGGRYSGKTLNAFMLAIALLMTGNHVAIFIFKDLKNEVTASIWTDLCAILSHYDDNFPEKYTVQKSTHTVFYGNAFIRCYGLHTQKKDKVVFKGYGHMTQRHVLNIFEEADEINPLDVAAVTTAERGVKPLINKFVILNFNPDNVIRPLVNEFARALPVDEKLLVDDGEQKVIKKQTLYHRTNRRVNPFYDWDSVEEKDIQNLRITDPELFKSWDLGIAGIGRRGVFTHVLKYVNRQVPENILIKYSCDYFGGVDFGFQRDAFAVVLCGLSNDQKGICVLKEFYFENEKRGLSHAGIAGLLMSTLHNWLRKINAINPLPRRIRFYCDKSDYAFMAILNNAAHERKLADYIIFEAAPPKAFDPLLGIGHLIELIGRHDFLLNEGHTKILYDELVVAK